VQKLLSSLPINIYQTSEPPTGLQKLLPDLFGPSIRQVRWTRQIWSYWIPELITGLVRSPTGLVWWTRQIQEPNTGLVWFLRRTCSMDQTSSAHRTLERFTGLVRCSTGLVRSFDPPTTIIVFGL
jgi:hypothetical protein